MPGGTIPPHDGNGPVHIAFAIAAGELAAWEERLREAGIEIEGRIRRLRGGNSIYFPRSGRAAPSVYLATPGLWKGY